MDSSVLLEGLARGHFPQPTSVRLPLRAVHVHHGLQPAADDFAAQAVRHAEGLGLACDVLRLQIPPAHIAAQGMEAAARQARRLALEAHSAGEWIALGHHLDDQIETTLLQWIRGAGLDGLCGMTASSAPYWRPMLSLAKQELMTLAQTWGLQWVEDPSNAQLDMDRNRIRAEVMPVITDLRAGARQAMGRSIGHLQAARARMEGWDEKQLGDCLAVPGAPAEGLRLAPLRALDEAERPWVLRAWLRQMQLAMPPERRLREFSRQLGQTRDGHAGQPGQNCELVVHPRVGGPLGFRVCLRASILCIQPRPIQPLSPEIQE